MAATGVRNSQMERLTMCPICLEKFRIPKVLPCMHTFCLTPCLTNLVDPRARSLRCPECRREHPIPPGGVQAFPANLTMIGFLDLQPTTTTNNDFPDRCFICKEQKRTLIECHDCSKFLCADCREPHLREAFYNITSSVSQLRRTLPKLSDKIASYEQRVNSVKTGYEQIRREITLTIATLIDELKHREMALLTEAEVYMQSQLRTFRIQQETAEVELASVASFCESVGTSNPSGHLINDADLASIRTQCNHYSQQINALQAQMPANVQQLQLTFDNQTAITSSIQNFGRLIDMSQGQRQQHQTQTSTNRVVQVQQPQFSSAAYPQAATHYVTTAQTPRNIQAQSQNDPYRHLENLYSSRGSTASQAPSLSQTISYRPTQNRVFGSIDNPHADLNLSLPARMNTSSYIASWNQQSPRRSITNVQSSSVFGPNPFATTNYGPAAQQPSVPSPEASQHRAYVTSMTAARSLEGDDRPIFGGAGGGAGGIGRGRARAPTMAPIQEQQSLRNNLQRRGTFALDQPSLPNLPQSGAQRPRDTVIVRELYNVRRRNRAKTPVAFTIDLNEPPQSRASGIIESGTA